MSSTVHRIEKTKRERENLKCLCYDDSLIGLTSNIKTALEIINNSRSIVVVLVFLVAAPS